MGNTIAAKNGWTKCSRIAYAPFLFWHGFSSNMGCGISVLHAVLWHLDQWQNGSQLNSKSNLLSQTHMQPHNLQQCI
jgi:hypothetical protein